MVPAHAWCSSSPSYTASWPPSWAGSSSGQAGPSMCLNGRGHFLYTSAMLSLHEPHTSTTVLVKICRAPLPPPPSPHMYNPVIYSFRNKRNEGAMVREPLGGACPGRVCLMGRKMPGGNNLLSPRLDNFPVCWGSGKSIHKFIASGLEDPDIVLII